MNNLNKISKNDLIEFAEICDSLFKIDKESFIEEALTICDWKNKGLPKINQEIQDRWYKSLQNDSPDYSIYNEIYYLANTWACWKLYSRQYLKSIFSNKYFEEIKNSKKVIDVGCGIGYSTKALGDLFPEATVFCTNLENTIQWDICNYKELNIYPDSWEIGKVDLIVAFEYFEHFENPTEHLNYLVEVNKPDYFLIANSFGTTSIGHFNHQIYNGTKVLSKRFGRIFNQELRKLGYSQLKTGIFNNKPSLWKRNSQPLF